MLFIICIKDLCRKGKIVFERFFVDECIFSQAVRYVR